MSPRSAEFYEEAKQRLAAAERILATYPAGAVSFAYYAMLYAARAALSERDTYAKTHRGTWHRFRETFIESGEFDAQQLAAAQDIQEKRERADYEAWTPSREEAEQTVALANDFVAAVKALIDA